MIFVSFRAARDSFMADPIEPQNPTRSQSGAETYDAFHTCNTWTALVLRDAGVPVDTHVLLADQVMQQVERIATVQSRMP